MSNIQLIKPNEGQKNWGNAINTNFTTLYNKYRTTLLELQGVKDRLEELDTIKISKTYFIYLALSNSLESQAYLNEIGDWDNPKKDTSIDWEDVIYKNYDAWFVKIDPNLDSTGVKYDVNTENPNLIWHTGDLLVLYKNSATNYSVEQWTNLMGGYYEPVKNEIAEDKIKTTYKKKPSFQGDLEVSINAPLVHWQPSQYSNGILTFAAYDGAETQLTKLGTKSFTIPFITKGNGNYYANREDNIITIDNVANDAGFDIYFTESGTSNTLLFSYEYSFTENNQLVITFNKGSYTGLVDVRVNVFKS